MKKIITIINFLIVFLLSSMVILMFISVFYRYVLGNSIVWSEELSRYLFVWFAYLGLIITTKEKSHVKIDFFVNLFSEEKRKYLTLLTNLLSIFLLLIIFYSSILFCKKVGDFKSILLNIPMYCIYISISVGFLLSLVFVCIDTFNILRNLVSVKNKEQVLT